MQRARTCLSPLWVRVGLRALQDKAQPRQHAHQPPVLGAPPHLHHASDAETAAGMRANRAPRPLPKHPICCPLVAEHAARQCDILALQLGDGGAAQRKYGTCNGLVRPDLHGGRLGCQLLPVDLRHQLLPQHRRHLGQRNKEVRIMPSSIYPPQDMQH